MKARRIEIVVVLLVLGGLSWLAYDLLTTPIRKAAHQTPSRAQVDALVTACEFYVKGYGEYPPDLYSLVGGGANGTPFYAPSADEINERRELLNPVGVAVRYARGKQGKTCEIWSSGENRQFGDDDDIRIKLVSISTGASQEAVDPASPDVRMCH